ncbi:hypothetical protein FLGE108171_04195 [Flavobacterium gelidilacus]|uniref:hypothetical protein n=1 Tax=Flavobacterium gelidilacus TaxID=206041 RepID=UPI00042888E7|nr:hypothetical protein [Flavobacterium gelidilacus]
MNIKHKITILVLAFLSNSYSQQNKIEFGAYNVGLGGFVGGIGALINNSKNEKPLKVFANGFLKGSIGGGFVHLSKLSIGEIAIKEKYEYSWLAKLNNSIGTSIIENASLNKKMFSKLHINIGFNRIELYPKEQFRVKYKIMPVSFLFTSYIALTNDFEFKKSIASGEFIFSSDNNKIFKNEYNGYTFGTSIVLNKNNINAKDTFSHEIIHVYQYYDYNFVNSFMHKPIKKLFSDSSFFSNDKLFYYDFQSPIINSLYLIEYQKEKYYDNFFEKEAGFYSNTLGDF